MEINNSTINFNISISKTDILQYFGTILIDFIDKTYWWLNDELKGEGTEFNWRYYYWRLFRKRSTNDTLMKLRNFLDDSRKNRCLIKYNDFIESMVKDYDLRFFANNLDLTTYCNARRYHNNFYELADQFDIVVEGSEECWIGESIKYSSMFPIDYDCDYDEIKIKLNADEWISQSNIQPHKSIIEIIETNTRSVVEEHLKDATLGDCSYEIPLSMEYDNLWIWKPNLFSSLETTRHRLETFNGLVARVCGDMKMELDLNGVFYTKNLDEKATIIQRCWIRSRYNYKYKIARKYINEGIKDLEDEIGLVLAD